jgi:hypothetical protein
VLQPAVEDRVVKGDAVEGVDVAEEEITEDQEEEPPDPGWPGGIRCHGRAILVAVAIWGRAIAGFGYIAA